MLPPKQSCSLVTEHQKGVQTARRTEEVRAIIKEGMVEFARVHHCEINGGVYLEKKTLDDIVDFKFNPGGGTAIFKSDGSGLSILSCRPCGAVERKLMVQGETAVLKSKGN